MGSVFHLTKESSTNHRQEQEVMREATDKKQSSFTDRTVGGSFSVSEVTQLRIACIELALRLTTDEDRIIQSAEKIEKYIMRDVHGGEGNKP